MKIRRFFAPDMRQAIRMVRDAQGPDAVILSSRRVEGGIEIVSAMDYDQELVSEMAHGQNPDGSVSARSTEDWSPDLLEPLKGEPDLARTSESRAAESRDREVVWSQDPTLVAMQREIENLRGMLQDQLASLAWNDLRQRDPERARLIRRLEGLGLDRDLARDIAAGVRGQDSRERAWSEALQGLARRLPVASERQLEETGIIALVGPSGVGKTTTVAKLAARHVRRYGRDSLALVTTDTQRIGAHRQLQTFGQILGVSVYLAQTGRELSDILSRLGDRQRIFVDTAGMSQRNLRLSEEMAGLMAIPGLRSLLVVAANTQQTVLTETFRAFAHLALEGIVLTKLDEAATLGPALSALSGTELPVIYLSEGQRVPEDLQPARLQRLIDQATAPGAEETGDPPHGEFTRDAGSRHGHDNLIRRTHVSA